MVFFSSFKVFILAFSDVHLINQHLGLPKVVSIAYLFSYAQNGKFQAGDVLNSSCHPQVDRVLNKGTLTVRQRDRILWGKPFCMIIITKAAKSMSKKQFQHGVRIGLLPAPFQKASVSISSWHLPGLLLRWRANLSLKTGALLLEVTFLKCTKFPKACIPL